MSHVILNYWDVDDHIHTSSFRVHIKVSENVRKFVEAAAIIWEMLSPVVGHLEYRQVR